MIYESVSSAVVSALAADCIDNTSKQAWQKLYQAGESGRRGGVMVSADLRQQIDCWVHARLHDQLIPRHWAALVAKYSTHQAKKVQAISLLRSVVATPAPALFLYKAITTWAIPKLKGFSRRCGKPYLSKSRWMDHQKSRRGPYAPHWRRSGSSGSVLWLDRLE